ncbi:MAG: Fe-S cluster assembly protein SufD [Opitutales bacterium]|nr:Fe-S cluster assembly protein SufD [Opitutales bacterium]
MSTETLSAATGVIGDSGVFAARHEFSGGLPDWFTAMQREHWTCFLESPAPTRFDETWRFSDLRPMSTISGFAPTPFEKPDASDLVRQSDTVGNPAGQLVFVDDNLATARVMDADLEKRGVIFTTLGDALNNHGDLVREYFMKETPQLGSEKYEALHVALMRSGVFLYVPDGVEVDRPFVVYNWTQRPGGAIFPHTLFVSGKNSKSTLVEFQRSASTETEHLAIANAHVFSADGSQTNHRIIQDWNTKTLSFQLNTNNARRDTNAKSIIVNVGSSQARQEVHGKIFGSGSNVEMYSVNVPRGVQQFDQRTLQTHLAPNSRSDLLFKNALLDDSRTIFSGLIIVEEGAQQTDAYQTNNNLMLSETAESNALPGLEIKANDVKCSHGATTGRIDESNLFYFLARGIPRAKAHELMVFGFLEEVIEKFEDESLGNYVRGRLADKFLA